MFLPETVRDIRQLKIQGAESISKAALSALRHEVRASRADTKLKFLNQITKARILLEQARPTEPCMRNTLEYVFRHSNGEEVNSLKESYLANIQKTLSELDHAEKTLSEIGSAKISNGMVVFTHCHSQQVMGILLRAKSHGKRFTVHNTETRPHFQGRKTAAELAKSGIKVTHYVDSAARLALKKADLMLIGCDSFTSEGKVINKIGSELFAEAANRMQVPVYVCTTSWKFDPKTTFGYEEIIEERDRKEVWVRPPRNVTVDNHAFERIDSSLITGMITELGIYKPEVLVEELTNKRTWLND